MKTVLIDTVIFFGVFGGVFGAISNNVTVDGLGTIIGSIDYTSWTNRTFYSFQNIPFAQAPIGDLRFRPPVAVTTWNGTLNGTVTGSSCPQSSSTTLADDTDDYNEDCLTLNVYVPEVNDTVTTLPVLIYIHGGTFMSGSASNFKANFLLEEDVILVVPQFRLGLLGLLCLQTDEVPGNVQFLDQIMAMQWVQDNIGYFGGDKDQVTVFGQSSGAASVNLHLLSPLSTGLFHRAIMNSGSALGTWVMDYDPVSTAETIASLLECNTTDVSSITTCMKNSTVQEILVAYNQYYYSKSITGGAAVIGGNRAVIQEAGDYKFLTEDPNDIVKNGNFTQLPLMGGVTKHDGSYLLRTYYASLLEPYALWNSSKYMEHNFTAYVVNVSGVADTTGSVKDTFINKYFANDELGDFYAMVPGLTDIFSVLIFKASVYEMLYYNSYYQDTYLYTFDYLGSYSLFNNSGTTYPFYGGVSHEQDQVYLFPYGNTLTESDLAIAKRMVQLWTSFVINGAPAADDVESWPAMSTRCGPYLIIDSASSIGDDFLYEYDAASREAASASTPLFLAAQSAFIVLSAFMSIAVL